MELKDLRIGNYVLINGKICVMDVKMFHAVIHGFKGYEPEPIKLNVSWLSEFNIHIQECPLPLFDIDRVELWWDIDTDKVWIMSNKQDEKKEIKYVHQLQNLFFYLKDVELETRRNIG